MVFMSVRRTETLVADALGTVHMTTKKEINSQLNSLINSLYILILCLE